MQLKLFLIITITGCAFSQGGSFAGNGPLMPSALDNYPQTNFASANQQVVQNRFSGGNPTTSYRYHPQTGGYAGGYGHSGYGAGINKGRFPFGYYGRSFQS